MTTTIYLTGQNNFGNRGCEALVRSTVMLLNQHLERPRILVPSADIARDSQQWPEAGEAGVEFVPVPEVPGRYVNWTRLCRRLSWLTNLRWPALPLSKPLADHLAESDAVLSIGGDIYSLDYGLDSPFFYAGIGDRALELGKTVVLWGASVGPFSVLPGVERQMADHLRRLSQITVRETHTAAYLAGIGVSGNLLPVVDSAFVLQPQPMATEAFWPSGDDGVLGLNISPVIEEARRNAGAATTILKETATFILTLLRNTRLGVLLVPHVAPLDGRVANNDETYLGRLRDAVGDTGGRVALTPSRLNACQLKYVISQCRYFIGARTHATIAAFSSAVPTVSIAYSVKARGINRDLFGHEKYVLPTNELSARTLSEMTSLLRSEEDGIRTQLRRRLEDYVPAAHQGAEWLAKMLTRNRSSCGARE